MSITAAQYAVVITADTKGAEEGMKKVGKEADAAGGSSGGLLKTLAGFMGANLIVNAAGAAFGFLKGQLVDSVKAGMGANDVIAQTVAGLKSTRDASGMTAQSIGDLATHLMDMSGIQDDAVQTSENMLLTFTNIGKNVFPQATQAAADLATKMNGGLIPNASQMQQVSVQLGKALNDPLKGITALTRVGVTFDAQQKAQIATMMKHGNVAGAQGVILKELNKEFGGAASAAGNANGGIAILTAKFDNLKQSLGQAIIPILTKLMGALQPLATLLMGQLSQAINNIAPLFTQLQKSLHSPQAQQFAFLLGILGDTVKTVGRQIATAALPVLKQFGEFFEQHLLPAVAQFTGFAAAVLVPMFGQIATFIISTVGPAVVQLGTFFTDTLLPAIEDMVVWFREHVLPVLMQLVKVFVTDVLPTLESLAKIILTKVVPPLQRLIGLILPILIPAMQAIGWVISHVVGPILGFLLGKIGDLIGKIADFVQMLETNFPKGLKAVGDFFHNLGTKVHDSIQTFRDAGGKLIQGLIDGIKGMASNLASTLGSTVHNAVAAIPGISGHLPGFAGGGVMPYSGTAIVGEHGAELVALPAGAQVYSHAQSVGMLSGLSGGAFAQGGSNGFGGAGAGGGQPIILVLDGRAVARGLLPYHVSEIRRATGIRVQ